MKHILRYVKNLLIAIDQLVNTLFGGHPDETISAVCYRKSHNGCRSRFFFYLLGFVLNLVLSPLHFNHCRLAYLSELSKRQMPREYSM